MRPWPSTGADRRSSGPDATFSDDLHSPPEKGAAVHPRNAGEGEVAGGALLLRASTLVRRGSVLGTVVAGPLPSGAVRAGGHARSDLAGCTAADDRGPPHRPGRVGVRGLTPLSSTVKVKVLIIDQGPDWFSAPTAMRPQENSGRSCCRPAGEVGSRPLPGCPEQRRTVLRPSSGPA